MLRKVFTLSGVVLAVSAIGAVESDVTHPQTQEFQFVTDDGVMVDAGYFYDNGTYSAPPPLPFVQPIPAEVTMRQACLALEGAGLLDDVEAIVATLPKVYQIEWLRASVVLRSNALVEMVRQQNSMTEAQIDALFVTAAAL